MAEVPTELGKDRHRPNAGCYVPAVSDNVESVVRLDPHDGDISEIVDRIKGFLLTYGVVEGDPVWNADHECYE
ncbi:hypothetical protein SAMN05444320_104144 [Streptoalloteichus hindustanus]|uniref:Uncharacterized protein n=1 Tax=Streptoalloteichus hindustanus TaxID=2017 RepID=A0A1M5CS53_STRHI|nr:hypothetical protein SAMN05444320_104144 [Streptoalloteichus hindustanus]